MKLFEFGDLIGSLDSTDFDLEPYRTSYLQEVIDNLRMLADDFEEEVEDREEETRIIEITNENPISFTIDNTKQEGDEYD